MTMSLEHPKTNGYDRCSDCCHPGFCHRFIAVYPWNCPPGSSLELRPAVVVVSRHFMTTARASVESSLKASASTPLRSHRLSAELVVGALVPPVLLGILMARGAAEVMTQVGIISEQLYQGQRLPTLNVSETENS